MRCNHRDDSLLCGSGTSFLYSFMLLYDCDRETCFLRDYHLASYHFFNIAKEFLTQIHSDSAASFGIDDDSQRKV